MTIKQLLNYYQKILGLQDWTIVLEDNCKPEEFILQSVDGECEYNEVLKCAVIRLLDQKYYGKRILAYDKETTLLHELLHIKFAFIDKSGNELQDRLVHQLVNDFAVAIVKVKRNNKNS